MLTPLPLPQVATFHVCGNQRLRPRQATPAHESLPQAGVVRGVPTFLRLSLSPTDRTFLASFRVGGHQNYPDLFRLSLVPREAPGLAG